MKDDALARTLRAVQIHGWTCVLLARGSKRPAGATWTKTADPTVITTHVKRGGNLGLCAKDSSVAVLDIDAPDLFAEMLAELGSPGDPWVLTGSGKLHVYVQHEGGLPAKLKWKGQPVGEIQRGENQQVVMPPSVHPDTGQPYEWLLDPADTDLTALPREWTKYLGHDRRATKTPTGAASRRDDLKIMAAQRMHHAVLRGDKVKFQCPACALEGHDLHGDNAIVFANGKVGCALDPAHRDLIRAAINRHSADILLEHVRANQQR